MSLLTPPQLGGRGLTRPWVEEETCPTRQRLHTKATGPAPLALTRMDGASFMDNQPALRANIIHTATKCTVLMLIFFCKNTNQFPINDNNNPFAAQGVKRSQKPLKIKCKESINFPLHALRQNEIRIKSQINNFSAPVPILWGGVFGAPWGCSWGQGGQISWEWQT